MLGSPGSTTLVPISSSAVSFGVPGLTLGAANAAGVSANAIRTDASIAIFDATGPTISAVGDAAAAGAAAFAARRDHTHGREAFAVPAVVLGTAAAAGAATTLLRSDATIVAFDVTVPTVSAVGDAAAAGTAAFAARRDHTHGREAFAVPAIVLGTAAAAGVATTPIRSDATIVAFDATAPTASAVGDAAAVGTAAVAARRDHVHGREAFVAPAIVLGAAAAAGVATTHIRSDATIVAFDATVPTTSAVGDAAAVGAAAVAARRDHTHGREAFAVPAVVLGTVAAAGVATTHIRSDATIVAFDATVPTTSAVGDAAAVGTAAVAARRDHAHGREAFAVPALTLGTANAAGTATTHIRSDATILAFDATVPAAVDGSAAAVGAATVAARRDHVHLLGATITNSLTFSNAAPAIYSAATPVLDANAATANLTIIVRRTAVNTGIALTIQSLDALNAVATRLTLTSGVATAVWDFANTTISNANLTTPTIAATGWTNANHAHAAANSGGQIAFGNLTGVSFGTPALTLGTANAAGVATTLIRSDATIAVFDATAPAAVDGSAAAAGTAAVAARRDHVHLLGPTITNALTLTAGPLNFTTGAAVIVGTTDLNSFAIKTNGATRWTWSASSGAVTLATATTMDAPAATAIAFRVRDGTNAYYSIDTTVATSGVTGNLFGVTNPSFASAAGSAFSAVGSSVYTLTLTGGVTVTALNGLALNLGAPTVTSATATTVTDASTLFVAAPVAAGVGPVTFTNVAAIMVASNILPNADNSYSVGSAARRFNLVRATTITSGDFKFENDWKLTEAETLGLGHGIALVRPDGSVAEMWS